jgi:hypothetical protein
VKQEQVLPKTTKTQELKAPKVRAPAPGVKKIPEKEISIETEDYWAVLTSDGARLKAFKFKKYRDRVGQSELTILSLFKEKFVLLQKAEADQEISRPIQMEKAGLFYGITK